MADKQKRVVVKKNGLGQVERVPLSQDEAEAVIDTLVDISSAPLKGEKVKKDLSADQKAVYDRYKALQEKNRTQIREPEVYGDVSLDIQASAEHFSLPRKNGIGFGEYTHYQVRIQRDETDDDGKVTTKCYKPSQVRGSLKDLDKHFNIDGLGAEIPKKQVNRLRINLVREIDSVDDIVIPDDGRLTSLPIAIIAKVKIAREVN